jgi:hypothetical protein
MSPFQDAFTVFWDFAFSIEKEEDAFVFIGSSSD